MKKLILCFHLLFTGCILYAQNKHSQTYAGGQREIKGEIIGMSAPVDTIYFSFGLINGKYFANPLLYAKLTGKHYSIKNDLPYPEMYKIYFAADSNVKPWREGVYFIDQSTTSIKTNYLSDGCSEITGRTANEYQFKFVPFVTKKLAYDCKSDDIAALFNDQGKKTDSLLLNYVLKNPDSYVAVWKLIERFSLWGQSAIRQQILDNFSAKIKSGQLWQILDEDFMHTKIKEGEKFPDIALKTYDLIPTKLIIPKAKYTLIDYWFCRCRPCLDTIPILKKLYGDYKEKGFDIVSISVDETVNVPLWQKRVKEHGLVWTQYLEENNFRVNELGIKLFPTFILLDGQGKIIWKDFDLHDLDNFLKKNT